MNKMMTMATVALLAAGALAEPASGQPVHAQPASSLFFPLFDSTPGRGTLITVTNTNGDTDDCPGGGSGGFDIGDIRLHYVYVNGDDCSEFNLDEDLTPGDMLTVFADQHNPEQDQGWLWVEARDPESGLPIDFDYLIGSAIIVDMGTDFLWSYTPYPFRALPDDGPGPDVDACGRELTDADEDGCADFNGIEYDFFPDILYLDNFFAEGDVGSKVMSNELTLMSPIDEFEILRFGIWNNDEDRFSRSFPFQCWTRLQLSDISLVVRRQNLGGDPNELVLNGTSILTGWVEIDAELPLLGVFAHIVTSAQQTADLVAGRELQFKDREGEEDQPNDVDLDVELIQLCRRDL